jgi:hypothetical protein
MKHIDRVLKILGRYGDVRHGNMFYEERGFVYAPARDWPDSVYGVYRINYDYAQAEKEAPLLRKRIIDEDQPLKTKHVIGQAGILSSEGGRITDAMLLGMIGYSDACPELLEAATTTLATR